MTAKNPHVTEYMALLREKAETTFYSVIRLVVVARLIVNLFNNF